MINVFHIGIVQIKDRGPATPPMNVYAKIYPTLFVIYKASFNKVFSMYISVMKCSKLFLILEHAMYILTSDTECIDDEACRYNGLCKDGKCICSPGYFGPGCQCKFFSAKISSLYLQFRLDHQCEGNPECNGHGKCNINTGHCICDSAYTGKDCSQTATILKKSKIELNCSKHNYCNITNEVCDTVSGLCICAEGYFGDNCQQSKCCENLVFC